MQDARLTWLSHARLSRGVDGGSTDRAASVPRLVVVDEAHAFRNPRTRRYRELARLCLGARVVLLTATPVNNSLLDLYSLIRLFAADTEFRDIGVDDLRTVFRSAALRPDAQPAPVMLAVLRAIMIRRTRPILRESRNSCPRHGKAGRKTPTTAETSMIRFPRRGPPRVLRYDLEATAPNLLDHVADCLDALTFAPFRIHAYGPRRARPHPSGAGELIRMMMLKRLESSVAAVASSVDAQIAFVEAFLEHLRGGRLLRPSDHRVSRNASDADGIQLLLGGVALDPLPRRIDAHALETHATADLEWLRTLRSRLPRDPTTNDTKLARLRELIAGELAGERVLVFTEFRETARYLWTALRDRGGTALIHGGGAFLGRARCGRREAVERFAPAANGAATPPPREAVRVLIATDVLSEGMNLQDARHVVSYDVPWNPVRLIQRIGRVDRLGSIHSVIFAHTFIPQRGLDRLIGLLERVRMKLAAIHTGVGAETCLPPELDAPTFLDRLARGDPRVLDEVERHDAGPFEAEERFRLAFQRVRIRDAEPTDSATPFVAVCRAPARAGDRGTTSVLLALRTGDAVRLAFHTAAGEMLVDSPAAFDMLAEQIQGHPHDGVGGAASAGGAGASSTAPQIEPDRDRLERALRASSQRLARRAQDVDAASAAAQRRRTTSTRVLSRRLLDALGRVPGGPDVQLCARAERLLATLARGGPAGLEHALGSLRRSNAAPKCAADLCDALEAVLRANERDGDRSAAEPPPDRAGSRAAAERSSTGAIELIGAIELRAPP